MKGDVLKYIDKHNIGIRRNCLYLLLMTAVVAVFAAYTMMSELEHTNEDYKELQSQAMTASKYYQKELVESSIRLSVVHSKSLRDDVSAKLERDYAGNQGQLRKDIDNYFALDNNNNVVYKDISKSCYKYVDKWYSGCMNVRLAVIGKTRVYFTSDSSDPIRSQRDLKQLFNMPQGSVAMIDKVTGDISVMQPGEVVNSVKDLSAVYLLTPAYIYDHADIFGNANTNPDGTQSDNSTLAVIVAVQPLSTETIHRINDFGAALGKDHLEETSSIIARGLVNIGFTVGLMVILGVTYTVLRSRQRKLAARMGGELESDTGK